MERVTINLTPRGSGALKEAVSLTGDSKTDCVNRALLVYAYIEQVLANGGWITAQEAPEDEPVRLMIF